MKEFILSILEQIPLEDLLNIAIIILGEGLHSLLIFLMILGMAFSGLCWLINHIVKCVFIWCWETTKKINFIFFRNKNYFLLLKEKK